MNKNLRTLCAALAISLMPIGAATTTCLATTTDAVYETIWVDAEKKAEDGEEKLEKTANEASTEFSISDIVRFKGNKEEYDKYMGKEIIAKIKVCKVKDADGESYIMSKDSSMKKAKCITTKEETSKCKEGDEVVISGTLKEINGNKVVLENAKILKVIDISNKEYNKDKYKNKTENKDDNKKDNKCEDNKKDNMKKDEDKKEENKKDKCKDDVENKKDKCGDKKEDKKEDKCKNTKNNDKEKNKTNQKDSKENDQKE
ncbi:MAG: hypothetical protein ACRC41_06000 [Sarcina sp.]